MSKRIKSFNAGPKIAKETNSQKQTEYKVSISFLYLTKNNQYNFSLFGRKEKNELLKIYENLFNTMTYINERTWKEMQLGRKNNGTGFEKITANQINFEPNGRKLSGEDVYVLRFDARGNKDGRVLGIRDTNSVFYIIGFDFTYSAYKH